MRLRLQTLLIVAALGSACGELATSFDMVSSVAIGIDSIDLSLGAVEQVDATVFDADGSPIPDSKVNWTSDNPQVVLVSTRGVLRAVGTGATTITAESGGKSATLTVAVSARFVVASAGLLHTCAVTDDGRTACWGLNSWGTLGSGAVFSSSFPVLVEEQPATALLPAAGAFHACSLASDGQASCWGANWAGQLGRGSDDAARNSAPLAVTGGTAFAALTAGDRHTCGIGVDGTLYCWGSDDAGQLGLGSAPEFCPSVGVACSTVPLPVSPGRTYTSVTAARIHTCAVAADGVAYCWGGNLAGQLGDGTNSDRLLPTPVIGGLIFESISSAALHTCGLTTDGEAYCWGLNAVGQLGDSTATRTSAPIPVAGGIIFEEITAGGEHTCGLTADGTAYCWGSNLSGQLGNGGVDDSARPVRVEGGLRFRSISAGQAHTCGVTTDGVLYCWGLNGSGQVGAGLPASGPTRSIRLPTRVLGQPL